MCHVAHGVSRWLFGVALGRANPTIMEVHGNQIPASSPLLLRWPQVLEAPLSSFE